MYESVRLIGLVMCVVGFAACGYAPLAQLVTQARTMAGLPPMS